MADNILPRTHIRDCHDLEENSVNLTPQILAATGAGLAALAAGAVLTLTGTAAATPTVPAGGGGVVVTGSVAPGVTIDVPAEEPRPTATVRSGQPGAQDPRAPVVVTVVAAPDATVDVPAGEPRPTATISATPAP